MVSHFARFVRTSPRARDRRGFTLVELMITLTVLAVVMVVLMTVMYAAQRSKASTTNNVEAAQSARAAMDMIARDLRSAGYAADLDDVNPQPAIAYIDSTQVLINANLDPYPDTTGKNKPPLAYNPNSVPKPFPLNGTSWQPPVRYRGGAEVIRWTLDTNNDGIVDAQDISDPDGADAQRTPNPNDYVLIREEYGDSTGGIAGNNGGTAQHIALIRKPGGTIPPLFRVYLTGSSTPWDWSLGPIPTARLSDIQRVEVQVVATASRRDLHGAFAESKLTTVVSSMRNVPNWGAKTYSIDGRVFIDTNKNLVQDTGELGINGAMMVLGNGMTTTTNSVGYFMFRVPAGSYSLRQAQAFGYGCLNVPDSFLVTVPPAQTRSFADSIAAGGLVRAHVYEDLNHNAVQDAGENPQQGIKVKMNNTGQVGYTSSVGDTSLFAPTGAYSLTITVPDSFAVSTPNPATGTMTNGGSAIKNFGIYKSASGTISGQVFTDNNRNNTLDAGESGVQNVWVGITPDGGLTVVGFQYTDASGNYNITVPANNPPGTSPYYAMIIVPNGYFATSTTSIGPLLVSGSQNITNQNFGVAGFTVISLNASRVLSLASADMIEKDWNGNQTQNARGDRDLVLGADASGTDQISVWFNQYNSNPLFNAVPINGDGYTRTAPQSVLALAVDTLDTNTDKLRPDVVTGTKITAGGNFFVWFNQNSGGNEGVLPTTYSTGRNYKTSDQGDVQVVLTADLAGASTPDRPDILVATKSPTSGQGTIELWKSDNATTPAFSRFDTYPTQGGFPGGTLGEVTCMALADFDGDSKLDLVVGTRSSAVAGKLIFLKNNGKTTGSSRFSYQVGYDLGAPATALTVLDVAADGKLDVVVGTQTAFNDGRLHYYQNQTIAGIYSFLLARTVTPPGVPTSLASADLGGLGRKDVVLGYRADDTSFVGGVRIYFTDAGTLPATATDPSGGTVTNYVPALTTGDFNYGVKPSMPTPPYLQDFAAGVKVTSTTGKLVVFVR